MAAGKKIITIAVFILLHEISEIRGNGDSGDSERTESTGDSGGRKLTTGRILRPKPKRMGIDSRTKNSELEKFPRLPKKRKAISLNYISCRKTRSMRLAEEKQLKKVGSSKQSKVKGSVRCGVCDDEFKGLSDLEDHAVREHPHKRVFCCPDCKLKFINRAALTAHASSRHSLQKSYCQFCKENIQGDTETVRIHGEECKKKLESQREKDQQHVFTVSTDTNLQNILAPNYCEDCEEPFAEESVYKRHCKDKHPGMKAFPCRYCCKGYQSKDNIMGHLALSHKDEMSKDGLLASTKQQHFQYICIICGETMNGVLAYENHGKDTHPGENLFPCKACGCKEGFLTKSAMNAHICSKHGNTMLNCNFCKRIMRGIDILELHESKCGRKDDGDDLPSKEKEVIHPYWCEYCKRTVRVKEATFKKHLVHCMNYEKCPKCESKFHKLGRRYNLADHIKRRHGPKEPWNVDPNKVICLTSEERDDANFPNSDDEENIGDTVDESQVPYAKRKKTNLGRERSFGRMTSLKAKGIAAIEVAARDVPTPSAQEAAESVDIRKEADNKVVQEELDNIVKKEASENVSLNKTASNADMEETVNNVCTEKAAEHDPRPAEKGACEDFEKQTTFETVAIIGGLPKSVEPVELVQSVQSNQSASDDKTRDKTTLNTAKEEIRINVCMEETAEHDPRLAEKGGNEDLEKQTTFDAVATSGGLPKTVEPAELVQHAQSNQSLSDDDTLIKTKVNAVMEEIGNYISMEETEEHDPRPGEKGGGEAFEKQATGEAVEISGGLPMTVEPAEPEKSAQSNQPSVSDDNTNDTPKSTECDKSDSDDAGSNNSSDEDYKPDATDSPESSESGNDDDDGSYKKKKGEKKILSKPRAGPSNPHSTMNPINVLHCVICDIKFEKESQFEEHYAKEHKEDYPHICNFCRQCFKENSSLLDHFEGVHAKTECVPLSAQTDVVLDCCICHREFRGISELEEHGLQEHPGENAIQCPQCRIQFARRMDLDNHATETNHAFVKLICVYCKKAVVDSDSALVHMKECKKEHFEKSQRFLENEKETNSLKNCAICKTTYKTISDYKKHYEGEHGFGDKAVKCKYCGMEYPDSKKLFNHMDDNHQNEMEKEAEFKSRINRQRLSFTCMHCKKEITGIGKFENHGKTDHPSQKIFFCSGVGCEDGFLKKKSLDRHMLSKHCIGNKKCTNCGKLYTREDHLELHKETCVMSMEGNTVHYCIHCSQTFQMKEISFKRHMNRCKREEPLRRGFGKKVSQPEIVLELSSDSELPAPRTEFSGNNMAKTKEKEIEMSLKTPTRTEGAAGGAAEVGEMNLEVVVYREGYPNETISPENLTEIRKEISSVLLGLPMEGTCPNFESNAQLRDDGVALIKAADNFSKDWLLRTFSDGLKSRGITFRVTTDDKLEKSVPISINIPAMKVDEKVVLRRLEWQNPWLEGEMSKFTFIKKEPLSTGNGFVFHFYVPSKVADIIKEHDHQVFFVSGTIKINF